MGQMDEKYNCLQELLNGTYLHGHVVKNSLASSELQQWLYKNDNKQNIFRIQATLYD